jgi:hypothetical protein
VLQDFAASLPSRVAAALLIAALSGAAGVAPRARAAEHRCQCQGMMVNGHHVCSCPICRLAERRAAARDRAAMGATDEGVAGPKDGGARCYVSECDHSGDRPGVRPTAEPFTLPQVPRLLPEELAVACGDAVSSPAARQTFPEVPPPRSHRS